MEISRFNNENGYSGDIFSYDIPPLSICTLSVECINCGALAEHNRTKHNCCQYGKVELASVNHIEGLKNLWLRSHSHATSTFLEVGAH